MGNRRGFKWKEKLGASAAHLTKTFTAPTSGLEDVYFTWGTESNTTMFAEVIGKLEEYVAIHFRDQAMMATRAMEELKVPVFVKVDHSRMDVLGQQRSDSGNQKQT